ncbi:PhnD/SsuA/transferrin family substrate-binding protein [Saliphagus sp. GCM10025334]
MNGRTKALYDGTVAPEGIDLTFLPLQIEETFWRMLKHQEFDAAEMSMSSYMMTVDRGDPELIAIPVFPSRFFRHSCIFINADAGIERPEDLAGCSVGVPEYQMTASLWCRGILQHEYGVAPEEMHWYHGGEEEAGREEKLTLDLPDEINIDYIPEDRTLSGMLETGDLDALVTARAPSSFQTTSVERLFENYRDVEMNYYRKTGHFPIMHTIVLRQDVYDDRPWVAQELYKVFNQAKQHCLEELGDTGLLKRTLPWLIHELEETRDLMGWDFWPYGVEDNRETLEFMAQMSYEQGLIKQQLTVEDLFAPTTFDEYKI